MSSKTLEYNWYDYPQRIYYWEKDVDYAMFIDENGNSSRISSIFKKIINNESIDENDRYFTITGCVFTKDNYRKAKKDIEKLKNKYWKKGIIMLEARGKKEDKQLLKHIYDVIYNKGRSNITTNELKSKIVGVFFNPKWNEEYSSTFMGIEIADLFSYPIHQFIKYKKENPAFKVLKSKIAGFPDYINKGIKIFPNIELFPK